MTITEKVIARDALRLYEADLSCDIWEAVKLGTFKFTDTSYTWEERLPYYQKQFDKYKKRCIKHGKDKVLDVVAEFLPKPVLLIIKLIIGGV